MSTKALTDAEIDSMAHTWWMLHDKPLEPIESFPRPLVPFNQLPAAGAGAIVAAAIREAIRDGEIPGEGREFSGFGGKLCMNCGTRRPEVSENGGWCQKCGRG